MKRISLVLILAWLLLAASVVPAPVVAPAESAERPQGTSRRVRPAKSPSQSSSAEVPRPQAEVASEEPSAPVQGEAPDEPLPDDIEKALESARRAGRPAGAGSRDPGPVDGAEEIKSMRTRDAKHFRNPDGSMAAIFGRLLHYEAAPGRLEDVDLRFRTEGADDVVDRSEVVIRVRGAGIEATERATGKGVRWLTPVRPRVENGVARFSAQGLDWQYTPGRAGIKLTASVPGPRGPQRYSFPYELLGRAREFTVDADGNLLSDAFLVPAPLVLGADLVSYSGGGWQIGPGRTIAFSFDDTRLPPAAFPYVLDPEVSFVVAAGGDDGVVLGQGSSYPPPVVGVNNTNSYTIAERSFYSGNNLHFVSSPMTRWNVTLPAGAKAWMAAAIPGVCWWDSHNGRSITADWRNAWPIDASDYAPYSLTSALGGIAPVPIISLTKPPDAQVNGCLNGTAPVSYNWLWLQESIPTQVVTGSVGLRFHISGPVGMAAPAGWNRVFFKSIEFGGGQALLYVAYDLTPPSNSIILSTTHAAGVPSSVSSLNVQWTAAADPESGVAGYTWLLSTDPNAVAPEGAAATSTSQTAAWTALPNGTYWFNLKAKNNATQWTPNQRWGPIIIDSSSPPVVLSPTLWPLPTAQSDELGLEQFYPYRQVPLGTGTGYVQLGGGNLVASFEDTNIPGQGLNAIVRHTYNSQRLGNDDGLGAGWGLSITDADVGLETVPGSLTDLSLNGENLIAGVVGFGLAQALLEFTDGDGTTHRFVRQGGVGARWDSPPGVSLKLREQVVAGAVSAYELIRPDGVVYRAENVQAELGLLLPSWRVRSITDRNSNRLTYTYGTPGNKVRVVAIDHSRNGRVVDLEYDSGGRLMNIVSLPGVSSFDPFSATTPSFERRVTFNYRPADGRLGTVVENSHPGSNASRTTTFDYDGSGRLNSVTDARGNPTRFGYTGLGTSSSVTTVTDRNGKPWTFGYLGPEFLTGIRKTVVASPLSEALPKDGVPHGDQVVYSVSPLSEVNPPTDRRRHGGNVIAIADDGYAPGAFVVTKTYVWKDNRLETARDGGGAETTFRYDYLDQLTEVTEPSPNDPARTDLPTGAPTDPTRNTLAYEYPDSPQNLTAWGYPCATGTCPGVGWLKTVIFAVDDNDGVHDTDPRVTSFQHDGAGNVVEVAERAHPEGIPTPAACTSAGCTGDRVWAMTYFNKGGLKSVDGPHIGPGDTTSYGDPNAIDYADYGGFDRSGQPTRIVDAMGQEKRFIFSPYGLVLQVTDREEHETKSRYDDRDNLVEVVDHRGDRTLYAYDGNDNKARETSSRGVASAAADDFTTKFAYHPNDWLTETTWPSKAPEESVGDPRPRARIHYFDDGSKRWETTPRLDPDRTAPADAPDNDEIRYEYYPNRALQTMDAPGDTTAQRAITGYEYYGTGRLRKVTLPAVNSAGDRPVQESRYSPAGLLTATLETAADAPGALDTTEFAYNAHGEQIDIKGPRDPGGVWQQTRNEWNQFGEMTKSERLTASNRWIPALTAYDLAGNEVRSVLPGGRPGDPISDRELETTFTYDSLNRLTTQTDPRNPGHTIEYAYTDEGQQKTRIDFDNGQAARTTTYEYNPDNTQRSMVATDHGSGTTIATCNFESGGDPGAGYDADGNLLVTRTVIGTGGCSGGTELRRLRHTYDPGRNYLATTTQGVRSPETGQIIERTQEFDYDLDGRRRRATHQGLSITYDHTPAGWLSRVTDWPTHAGSVAKVSTVAYRPSGSPVTQSLNSGGITGSYEYHADGSPKDLVWRAGTTVLRGHTAMVYDGALRTREHVEIRQPSGTITVGDAAFEYDLLDRLDDWTAPVAEANGARFTNYVVDDGGNIRQEISKTSRDGTLLSTTDAIYEAGRLKARNTTPAGALPTPTCETFGHNPLGEEESRTKTSPLPGLACPSTGPVVTETSYNPAGQTSGIDDLTAANADVNYVYDTTDRLIARTEPAKTGSAKTTLFFYWGTSGSLAEETDGSGNTMVRYVVGSDEQVIAQESWRAANGSRNANATWSWMLPDAAGNVATHVSDANAVLEQVAYDPYGQPKAGSSSPATSLSTLGFQGAITDRTMGRVALASRLYDPTTTRFPAPDTFVASALDLELSLDPLTGNRYMFAAANPVAYFEDGHRFWEKVGGFVKKGVPFIPVIGTAVDVVSAASGRDLLNGGKKLSGGERLAMLGTAAIGAVPGIGTGAKAAIHVSTGVLVKAKRAEKVVRAVVSKGDEVLETAADACRVNSFVPGTPVLMADGTSKAIKDVDIGDFVLATDPERGEYGPRKVTDLIIGDGWKDLVRLEIDGETTVVTAGHPFWDAAKEAWIEAAGLEAGDELLRPDGSTVVVDNVSHFSRADRVYNLTVDDLHTYYAGLAKVLTHNCAQGAVPPAASGQAKDVARFIVRSADDVTLRARGPSGWMNVSSHAAKRLTRRRISIEALDATLTQRPFRYWHAGQWKTGYYDPLSRVFVGTANDVVTTVFRTTPTYIDKLRMATP